MHTDKVKALAIAKLKNGEKPEAIGNELEISATIVKEWAEQFSADDMLAKEVNAIALTKAGKLLQAETITDTEKLQLTLLNIALAITDEIKVGLHDCEIAKALNISASTIAILQNAFYGKSQIAIINNNNNNVSDELKVFKGALRS